MGQVSNRRRNQLLLWSFTVVGITLTGTIAYLMFRAFPGRPLRPAVLAIGLSTFWVWLIWTSVQQRRNLQEIERELDEAGVAVPDEEPIPIRLAESRESLIVGIIILLLIAMVFAAYFGGWIR